MLVYILQCPYCSSIKLKEVRGTEEGTSNDSSWFKCKICFNTFELDKARYTDYNCRD